MFEFSTVNNVYSRKSKYVDSSTDSVLIKFTQEFDICGVFEFFFDENKNMARAEPWDLLLICVLVVILKFDRCAK